MNRSKMTVVSMLLFSSFIIKAASAGCEELQQIIAALKGDISEARINLSEKDDELREWRDKFKEQQDKVEKKENDLKELQDKLSEKNDELTQVKNKLKEAEQKLASQQQGPQIRVEEIKATEQITPVSSVPSESTIPEAPALSTIPEAPALSSIPEAPAWEEASKPRAPENVPTKPKRKEEEAPSLPSGTDFSKVGPDKLSEDQLKQEIERLEKKKKNKTIEVLEEVRLKGFKKELEKRSKSPQKTEPATPQPAVKARSEKEKLEQQIADLKAKEKAGTITIVETQQLKANQRRLSLLEDEAEFD